jgi:hypothetical protein
MELLKETTKIDNLRELWKYILCVQQKKQMTDEMAANDSYYATGLSGIKMISKVMQPQITVYSGVIEVVVTGIKGYSYTMIYADHREHRFTADIDISDTLKRKLFMLFATAQVAVLEDSINTNSAKIPERQPLHEICNDRTVKDIVQGIKYSKSYEVGYNAYLAGKQIKIARIEALSDYIVTDDGTITG